MTDRNTRSWLASGRQIVALVCRELKVPPSVLVSSRKTQGVVRARHIAMWLMRYHTSLSYPQIAQLLGRRDHSTVIYGVRKVDEAIEAMDGGRDDILATLAHHCETALLDELVRHHEKAVRWQNAEREAWQIIRRGRDLDEYLQEMKSANRQRRPQMLRLLQRARSVSYRLRRLPRPYLMNDVRRVHVPKGRTLTQELMGDPPPGRSALEQMAAASSRSTARDLLASLRISSERRIG